MGTVLTSASSTIPAPGPNGQAAVLPLSIPPACEAPRSTVRCLFDDCRLIQFVTSNRLCRKCHRPLDKPVVVEQQPQVEAPKPSRSLRQLQRPRSTSVITTTEELDDIAADAANESPICPALARFDQCLPVVLVWLRAQAGMSQREIAERAGLRRVAVNSFERGRTMPMVDTVEKMATALSTDMVTVLRMCEYLRDGR